MNFRIKPSALPPDCPRLRLRLVAGFSAAIGIGAGNATAAEPGFTDQTASAGLSFVHALAADTPGDRMHSGGSVGDFNNDDWPDLFVIGGGDSPDRLYINNQDGSFTDEAADWQIAALHRGGGSAVGDYNSDGWQDLFVASKGDMSGEPDNGMHKLYRNNGDGTFTDVAVDAGVNSTGILFDGYGATFGDYDLDGNLDLWVGGWHRLGENNANTLFRNNGDGSFTNVTVSSGVWDENIQGFGAIFADMNADRYPELLVSGDFGTSAYYANNRDGTFTRIDIFGSNKVWNGMGTTLGDFNRDGLPDWFITAIWPAYLNAGPAGNRLYMNNGNHSFSELPEAGGVNNGGWGWGTNAQDFDHDGWVDIVMTDGWVVPNEEDGNDPITGESFWDESAYLFRNNGDETFTEVATSWGIDHHLQGRGLVQIDYDRDGDIDVVMFSNPIEHTTSANLPNAGELHLYRNELINETTVGSHDAHWLRVELDTSDFPHLAPQGDGAIVRVRVGDEGGQPRHITVESGSNYLGQGQVFAHFGLGDSRIVREVFVEWQDGFKTYASNVQVNQTITLKPGYPYSHGTLIRGQTVDFKVTGLRPGETASFLAGATGTTDEGNCYPQLGGVCTDIDNPTQIGTAIADASGTAILTVGVPELADSTRGPADPYPTPPGPLYVDGYVFSQVLIARGPNGVASLKTNVIGKPVYVIGQ